MCVFERAAAFAEVGAGIQIGPNVTRLLHGWGFDQALEAVAAFPERLQVRGAVSGRELGLLRLGDTARQRYGAPYATLHRADLHAMLLEAVRQHGNAALRLDCGVTGFAQTTQRVAAQLEDGRTVDGDILLGADGLWSAVRQGLLKDGPPRVTGHLAYRALLPQSSLPAPLRSQHITVWLGPDLHVVHYPVRGGEWLNVVGIVHAGASQQRTEADGDDTNPDAARVAMGDAMGDAARDAMVDAARDPADWSQRTSAAHLRSALQGMCAPLQDLIQAMDRWQRWELCDRAPLRGAQQMAGGRVALLGDAAHPMLPYLAQGAGMAIEDAAQLGTVLADEGRDAATALRAYAERRWRRNARVQARAVRNGAIFHARGPVRIGRDIAMKASGERLLDLPWLYRK